MSWKRRSPFDLASARASRAGFGAIAKAIFRAEQVRDGGAPSPTRVRSPDLCLHRLRNVSGAVFETGELLQERQRHFTDGAVALLGDNQLRLAGFFRAGVFVFLIDLRPNKQANEVRILFNGARFT